MAGPETLGLGCLGSARIRAVAPDIGVAGRRLPVRLLTVVGPTQVSAATAARRRSAARQFYRFALAEGWRTDDPSRRLDAPKQGRPLPKVLSREEIDRLLEAAGRRDAAAGLRLVALVELAYASGLRVSELLALKVEAVRRDPAYLIVRGKGGKERLAPLNAAARTAVKAWLTARDAKRKPEAPDSPWLFPSSGRSGHLTPRRFAPLSFLLAVLAVPAAAIEVDGRIDPAEWAGARHVVDFRKVQPLSGEPASLQTEAWVLATAEGLAVAFRNRQPASVPRTRQRVQRDFDEQVDRVNLMVDFDGDGRTGYNFVVASTGGSTRRSRPAVS